MRRRPPRSTLFPSTTLFRSRPHLTRLGSGDWARTKERVRRAVSDLAQELLQLYAAREVLPGHAFAEDTVWQQRSEEHTSELQSRQYLVCRLLLEKKKKISYL